MSYVAPDTARETHITSLHEQFDRAGVAASMADALGTLQFLREAETLDGGYWIPAPTRVIDLGGKRSLIVGVHPTAEFRRHFGSAQRAGAGRAADSEEVAGLPRQSLAAWRGHDGIDASIWARTAIELAMRQLAPSIVSDGLEAFAIRTNRGTRSHHRAPSWVRADESVACAWRGVGLFRSKTSTTRHRYFLGRHQSEAAFLEGPPVRDSLRMQFGLAALLGQGLTIKMASTRGALTISLPLSPPTALRRLLVALCDADMQSFGRIWTCRDPEYLPVLLLALQELECETAHHE